MSQSSPKPNQEIQRLCREAEAFWKNRDFQKSLNLLEQASQKEPSNLSLLLHLARGYGLRYDYSAVECYLEKALQVTHGRVEVLEEAARLCSTYKNLDLMLGYLERASQKKGISLASLISLADIYLLDHRLDEAAAVIERASQMDRKDLRTLLRAAVLKQQRRQLTEAESQFRDLLTNPAAEPVVRIRAAYALANILDTAGQYDDAMTALLEAKAIQRAQATPLAPHLQRLQNLNEEMARTITAPVLDRWRASSASHSPTRRLALLSGHPRSGTTLLEQVLDAHTDVVSAEETTLAHDEIYRPIARDFPPGAGLLQILDSAPLSLLTFARENYFHCAGLFLRQPIGNRLLLDKNPGVNFLVPVLLRINPETKFLVALRDPRDVVMSCFMQALTLTPASSAYLTVEGAVNQYASTMSFWLALQPRLASQTLQVRYEEMVDDLPTIVRTVLAFLGLEFQDNVLKFYEHARTKRVNSPTSAEVRQPTYRTAIGRWKNYEKYLDPYLPALHPFLKEFNYH